MKDPYAPAISTPADPVDDGGRYCPDRHRLDGCRRAIDGSRDAGGVAAASSGAAAPASSSGVFRQYCVGCHNERMKANFGNLSLEGIDPADVAGHAETLEKVVRKLRKGQMPPLGRPRPDAAALEAFVVSLESALDAHARRQPNPGRVVSRRLNRAEYVNAVYDLIGLEVNGSELLPSDMAGFGFDNNADVLSITPALMARYITAGDQDQPRRAGDSGQPRGDDPLQGRDRHTAGSAHGRGDAVRLVRRPRRQAHVPARRRVRVPAAADARSGWPDQRHHGRARHRAARRPRARASGSRSAANTRNPIPGS